MPGVTASVSTISTIVLYSLRRDAAFVPARFNLANLYNRLQRNADAEHGLREGLQMVPQDGEIYYALGLLLAEEQRLVEAVDMLRQATHLRPNWPRVHDNYGLTLQHLGRRPAAEVALLDAHRLSPQASSILKALAIFYIQGQQWDKAEPHANELVRLYPNAIRMRRSPSA